MSDDELHNRLGDLISTTNIETVLTQLAYWLRGRADVFEVHGYDSDSEIVKRYRTLAKKLFREATVLNKA